MEEMQYNGMYTKGYLDIVVHEVNNITNFRRRPIPILTSLLALLDIPCLLDTLSPRLKRDR
jgi:hypothetical protein